MIQRTFLFLLLSTVFFSSYAQKNSSILKAQFENEDFNGSMIYIQKIDKNRTGFTILDSVVVDNNNFQYTTDIKENTPTMMIVLIKDVKNQKRGIIFSPEVGNIAMTIGHKTHVGGSLKNDEIQNFLDVQNNIENDLKRAKEKYSNLPLTDENRSLAMQEFESSRNKLQEITYVFAKSNINNDMGEYIILSLMDILSPEQTLELLKQTRADFQQSNSGKSALTYTEAMLMRSGKGYYKDLTLMNIEGQTVSLSDYVGHHKLVLLDFWASWCAPCIREMPFLVELYNAYKDKGFEIIGISLDEDKNDWMRAIDKYNITWPQMSDLKGWTGLPSQIYGVSSIPYTVLLDQKGNIVGTFLRGDDLIKKVKEFLN